MASLPKISDFSTLNTTALIMYPPRKTYNLIHVPRDVILHVKIASAKMAPFPWFPMLLCFFLKTLFPSSHRVPSSETQGQIVGARESLNGRENMARRKVKTGGKEPLGTMSYQTSLKFSGTNLASSLYGVLLVPIGQFISVTYPRRTGGERPHIFFRMDHVTRNALAARNNEA